MALLERLQILIDADAKGAIREFDKIGKEAAKASGKVEGKFAKLSNNLTNIGSGVALGGVAVLGGLGKLAMMSEEAEKQTLKLDNSIKNSTQSFAGNGKALKDLANSLQQVTASDADALVGAESLLVSFGLTEDQIKTLLPLVNDFSRKFGVDLDTAAKTVGKALNGSAGGLKKYGVEIDKTALKADAFGTVVESLAGSVGGFARTEGQTFSGQLEILKNNLGDLGETVGKGAAGVFKDLAGGAASAANALNGLNPAIGESVGRVGAIGGIAATAIGGLAVLVGQFGRLKAAAINAEGGLTKFGKAASAIGAVSAVVAIVQIGDAINQAKLQSDEFKLATEGLGQAKGPKELGKSFRDLEQSSKSVTDRLNDIFPGGEVPGLTDTRVQLGDFSFALIDVDRTLKSLADSGNFEQLGIALEYVKTNAQGNSGELERLASITEKYEKKLKEAVPALVAGEVAQRKQTKAVAEAVDTYDLQNATLEGITKRLKEFENGLKATAAEYAAGDAAAAGFAKSIEQSTRLDDAASSVNTLRGSIQGLNGDLTGIPKSINDALDPFANVSEQGQKAVDAVISFGNSSIGYIQQLIAQGAGDIVPVVAEKLRGQLTAALQAAGVPPDQIDDYLGLAGLDPIQIDAALKVGAVESELSTLKTRLDLFKKEIEDAPPEVRIAIDQAILAGDLALANRLIDQASRDRTTTIYVATASEVQQNTQGVTASRTAQRQGRTRAVGGPVNKSMDYMVNERGPEMFVPNSSGFIMTSNDSKALISGVNSLLQGGYSSPSNTFNITTTDPVLSAVEVVRRQRDANYLLGR